MLDSADNCPAWFNPDQSLPPLPITTDDPDCDGMGSAIEGSLGTDPMLHCAATSTRDDEEIDAWPLDADDDRDADIGDIIFLFQGRLLNPQNYDARADFNADGDIDLMDLIIGYRDIISVFGIPLATCD